MALSQFELAERQRKIKVLGRNPMYLYLARTMDPENWDVWVDVFKTFGGDLEAIVEGIEDSFLSA